MSVPHSIDAGLQPERTSLSFVRTCLSILGLVVACLRWLPPSNPTALVGPAIAGTLVAGAAVNEHRSRPRRMTRFAAESATPAIVTGGFLVVSVALLSLSGLWFLVH
ncbi:DUF202 domain-containing protein [Rhodococcus wratislaviensis]|uniref:DUF202 domain-containing protein n=1 Tax=Rhodococcus wratislaviensis TaxID=44752 RepID=UPI00351111C2